MKILMVCLGNICRSPLAEGIMQAMADESGLAVKVDSAGTSDYHEGDSPDDRAVRVAQDFGIDISRQRSRPFTVSDLDHYDLIFAMDEHVLNWLLLHFGKSNASEKMHLFLKYAGTKDQSSYNVKDPYYGGEMEFRAVFKVLEKGCDAALKKMFSNTKGA